MPATSAFSEGWGCYPELDLGWGAWAPCGAQECQGLSLPHMFVFNREATTPWWLVAFGLFVFAWLLFLLLLFFVCL